MKSPVEKLLDDVNTALRMLKSPIPGDRIGAAVFLAEIYRAYNPEVCEEAGVDVLMERAVVALSVRVAKDPSSDVRAKAALALGMIVPHLSGRTIETTGGLLLYWYLREWNRRDMRKACEEALCSLGRFHRIVSRIS